MPNNQKNTRRCIVCRNHSDKSEMLRFVKSENGVVIDNDKKVSGRGVYVHNNNECIEKLKKKKMLNGAFRCNVGDDIYEEL